MPRQVALHRQVVLCSIALVVGVAASCSENVRDHGHDDGDGGSAAGGGAGGEGAGGVPGPSTSDKVDLLFVVDNSRSMSDKQEVLAASVASLTDGLVAHGVTDMHVGIISSSLGGVGADACEGAGDPSENDAAHLIARDGLGGSLPTYQDRGFLVWDPNQALSPPGEGDAQALANRTGALISGADELGCGYESPLESFYRFLVDPNPYQDIAVENGIATFVGTDQLLLGQRAEFLRPDSLVIIVILSDENDCSTRAGGQFFMSRQIYQPGTNNPYHLPPARAACATNPADPCCRSCGESPGDGCDTSADACSDALPSLEDNINLRCFEQKRRFGVDFSWPIDRYASALNTAKVTDNAGNVVDNPLYTGQRGSELVLLATIVGAPWQLTSRGGNPSQGALAVDEIDAAGWSALLGDPASFVPPGDAHMRESIDPRPGLPGPSSAPNADPIHGREYTNPTRDDLQYACIFPLPTPRDCTGMSTCDCGDASTDSPICEGTSQVSAKAYPGLRELALARAHDRRAVVGSICPVQQGTPAGADFGYHPTFTTLLELAAARLE